MAKTADAKDSLLNMNEHAWNTTMQLHTRNAGVDVNNMDADPLPTSTLKCDDGADFPIAFKPETY